MPLVNIPVQAPAGPGIIDKATHLHDQLDIHLPLHHQHLALTRNRRSPHPQGDHHLHLLRPRHHRILLLTIFLMHSLEDDRANII